MQLKSSILIIILLVMSSPEFLFAQEGKRGYSYSIKAGITVANHYGEDALESTNLNGQNENDFYANNPASVHFKSGMHLGGGIEYRFNKLLSVGLGGMYIQKGARINANSKYNFITNEREPVNSRIIFNQSYLQINAPIKLFIPINKNELHFYTGPTFGIALHSRERGKVKINDDYIKYKRVRYTENYEFGYELGMGYNYYLAKTNSYLSFDIMWNRTVFPSLGSNLIPNPNFYYNQTINFSIAYRKLLNR